MKAQANPQPQDTRPTAAITLPRRGNALQKALYRLPAAALAAPALALTAAGVSSQSIQLVLVAIAAWYGLCASVATWLAK